MEEMKPEKEPLKIDDESIPPEMMSAMKPLLDLSRQVLWHWKTFPIILPQPITVQTDPNSGTCLLNLIFMSLRQWLRIPRGNQRS